MTESGRKLLGIIGGMGAAAGADVYRRLVELTPVQVDQDHIPTLLHSNTDIPDRTAGILGTGPSSEPHLLESARLLERNGVDLIILACVTSHHFIDDVRAAVACRVLSAIEETVGAIVREAPAVRSVAIMATTGTITTNLFQNELGKHGLEAMVLPEDLQDKYVMEGLYGHDGIKAGFIEPARTKMLKAIDWLTAHGAEAIISGCSELPLLYSQKDCPVPLFDAMDCLIRQTIMECTGKQPRHEA
ncbi:amino acid racemase [candidate division GN15 bacterium]|nr:amino acid racemase [candidate division GN15 bacterium]